MELFLLGMFAGSMLLLGALVLAAKASDLIDEWKSLRATVEYLDARAKRLKANADDENEESYDD